MPARLIFETIGAYLGYTLLQYAAHCDFDHVLVLGRVATGSGGGVILEEAARVLRAGDPALGGRVLFHSPDETARRHGQAAAAAILPKVTA